MIGSLIPGLLTEHGFQDQENVVPRCPPSPISHSLSISSTLPTAYASPGTATASYAQLCHLLTTCVVFRIQLRCYLLQGTALVGPAPKQIATLGHLFDASVCWSQNIHMTCSAAILWLLLCASHCQTQTSSSSRSPVSMLSPSECLHRVDHATQPGEFLICTSESPAGL